MSPRTFALLIQTESRLPFTPPPKVTLIENFSQRLLRHAAATPNRAAVQLLQAGQPDHTLTYADLCAHAAGYAAALAAGGVQPGEVVIIILQHGAALLAAYWGVVLHGAVPAIMPFLTEKLARERYLADLASLLRITQPAALITYAAFENAVRSALPPDASVRAVLLSEAVTPLAQWSTESLAGTRADPHAIALLQHSSGTTGLQKGVALSHQAVFNQLQAYGAALQTSSADVVVSWLPLYHDMGLIAGFIMPILSGMPLVLLSPFDWVRRPALLLQAISTHRGTLTWLPNFALNFCAQKIRERDLEGVDLRSLRALINCSEPTRAESHTLFAQRFAANGLARGALATCYAMAENVFAVTQSELGSAPPLDVVDPAALSRAESAQALRTEAGGAQMLSNGRALPNVQIEIRSADGAALPERHLGEIALRSDCLLESYYKRPDLTGSAFSGGWYLTGDLGYLADAELYITGRKKDVMIVGGKNIHPHDIEDLAGAVAGVHRGRVVAFGVFNAERGTEDVVLVAEADTPAAADVAAAVRDRVNRGTDVALAAVHLVPPGWIIKTSSGKAARSANRDKYQAAVADAAPE